MLGFVGCVVKAAVFRRVFILLVVLHSVICNDSLNGLLSSPSKVKSEKCTLATTPCVPIAQHLNRTCLGNHLPYKLTASIPLDEDVTFYSLKFWSALQSIPSCWDKLQFFLCSVYIPECVIIPTSKTTESNQSYSNNYSVSVTNYQESNRDYLPVNNSPSSSSPSFINVYRVVLPEAEMCEAVHKACPLLFSLVYSLNGINNINNAGTSHINSSNNNNRDDITTSKHSYPKFLDCSLYTPGCRQNKLTARLFQSNGGGCQSPLVTTSLRRNWIPGIERCSFPCRRPHFDSEHYKLARWITGCSAIVCLCTNILSLFTIRLQLAERLEITLQLSAYIHRLIDSLHLPTFSTDRKSHLIYRGKSQLSPSSVVAGTETKATTSSNDAIHNNNNINNPSWYLLHTSLFYIHLFLIFGCFGWLLPLLPNIGEYVACREDGSLRIGEPQISSGKSVLCIVDFILLYFSSMAAAIWSNIFDYALLYQIKKINFNLSNPQHHQYPSQHHHHHRHHHHHHHGRQEQHHRYADLEMKHFQSRVTKSSGNSSKKHNKSSECFTTMQKRISDEPLSEITNSINLTNEKSSEFEICNEEHLIAVNDTAFNAANNNTADITIQPSISKDCRNKNNNKSECKSKKPHLSEFSSSSASSAPSSPPSMTSSSSLLLLSTQNVDNTKMKECIHLSNILTTTTATVTKSHNPENELQTKQGRDLTSDHRNTIGTAVNDDNYKRDHDNAEVVDDVDIDNDDALDGHSLNTMSNFYVTNHTANTTIPAATTCSHMKSLMLKHGVIISSSMHNQTINTQPQTTCLHLLALAIPLVFTLIILTAAEIDGNSLSGICSVGLINIWARVGLLLIPITLCLVIKFYYFIQLILQFMKLRHKFLLSSFRVDHKIAQRLVRYSLFYIIFLIFLLGLWLFSICIHTYIYLNEPVWLESQRLLFLCRIRYRLLGLDELAAVNVCVGAASSYESDDTLLSASAFNIHSRHMPLGGNSFFMNGVSIDSHHSSQSVSDLLLIKSSDLQHQQYQKQQRASQSVQQTNNNEGKTTRISTYLPIEEMSVRKPSVGPVLLHLLLYFAINLLYNSMILLDPSVKRSWWYLLKRVIFWCQWKKQKFSQSLRQQQHHVRAQQYTRRRDSHQNPHHLYVDNVADDYDGNYNGEINLGIKDKTDYLIKSYLNNITIGFSWWDPGFFTIPTPILSSNDLWIKWNTLLYSNEEHMKQLMRKQNIVASSLLSSKQDSELVQCKSSLPAGNNNSVNNTTLLNNCTNIHDADADNENTGNRCNITDFHVTPDQFNCVMNSLETLLLVATPNDLLECPQHLSTLLSKLILSSNTDCLKQSFLDQQHSQLPSTSSSALTNNISNNNLESALFILRQLYQLSSSTNMVTANCPQDNFIATNIATNTTTSSSSSSSHSKNASNFIGNICSNHQSELNSSVNLPGSHLFNNSLSHDSNLQATLTAAVAYEHYQKQLSDLTTNIMRRRSRHKRLLSGRSSIRRHSQSHSLSTNGVFLPNFTTSMGFKTNGTNSSTCSTEMNPAVKQPFNTILTGTTTTTTAAVSSFSSSSSCLPRRGSFNFLQAAASIIAAAAASTSNTDSIKYNNNSTFNSRRRLSQSGLSGTDAFSTHHLDSSSGAASAFGGSQISSTSIRSALTSVGISNRHRHHRRRKNNHTRPSSTSEALLTNNINNNISTENELKPNIDDSIGVSSAKHSSTAANNNNNIHNMGSRISSLRSISCASSSGAESYNSYRLLINQAGASWRELWRTRMLLMHVLRWAENVAPFMQSNNSTNSSNNVNSNVIHNECSKSQISLLNCFDTSTNNNSVDCVKTTLITSTSVTNTPTTVPACNCNDNRSNTFSVGHQLPIFNPISSKIDETSDFNAQLVQLIISLIEKQRQPVDSRTESQSKLDIESQLPTNLLGTKCADEQASQYPTNSDTTITNSSGINYTENHFIGQTYPLTSIDPMMAAAFAAATAAATVALQQQHQRQNQQAFRQSSSFNSTSPADGGVITSGKPTTINNNYINQFNPSVGISSNNVINNQFCNDLYPFMTQWTSGSGSLGPLPQDVLHSSTSLSNNLSHFVTKNTSPYSQDDYLSPGVLSSTFSHHRPPPYNSNSLRFHAPYSNGHNNNNNQSSSTHCINTEGSYHHHLMPSNSGYATNISDNHHQCTAAPDLLIDHNQLSTGSRDKYINNPSSCSRLFTGGQQQSQPQQLPVNPLFGCFHHSVNSTVTPSTDILQVPSSASNSQQNKQANASTNPFNILPRSSFYTEPNSTDTILISSQNTGFEPNVNLLLANSFSKTAVQGDDLSVNNDSDAFNSEDEIISVNDEDNVIEMDKSLCPNESVESDIKQQRKQLLTYTPNQFNTYEQHMIASITNPNTYFMPNFINSNLHHLTAIESTIVTTTLTSMTTYPHSSHPLSPYSNMIMQTKRNIYNVSPDDGEMSSVSQSASQIVPCESSQSSSSSCTDSSSSSPSKLLPKLNPYELNHIVTDSLYSSTGHQKHTTNAEDNHTDDVPALTTLLPSDKNQSSSHDDINDVKIVDETIKSTM
ncbi:Smoothened like [Schistosoma japonicum]|nr:Smoothened like [Schistosoma japonicum]